MRKKTVVAKIDRRKIIEARELWLDIFMEAITTILSVQEETLNDKEVVIRAEYIADEALRVTEERWPNV